MVVHLPMDVPARAVERALQSRILPRAQSITAAPEAPLHHTDPHLLNHQAGRFPLCQRARPYPMNDPPDLPVFPPVDRAGLRRHRRPGDESCGEDTRNNDP